MVAIEFGKAVLLVKSLFIPAYSHMFGLHLDSYIACTHMTKAEDSAWCQFKENRSPKILLSLQGERFDRIYELSKFRLYF